jgi:hypothetical protein
VTSLLSFFLVGGVAIFYGEWFGDSVIVTVEVTLCISGNGFFAALMMISASGKLF